jgi:hypothetical protein
MIIFLVATMSFFVVTVHFDRPKIKSIESDPINTHAGQIILGYTVEYPPYVVNRENEQFTVTLVNSSTISLTHVMTTLVFSSSLPINSDTTVAQFETLTPGEGKTRTIHFALKRSTDFTIVDPPIEVQLKASSDQFTEAVSLDVDEPYMLNAVNFPIETTKVWLVWFLSILRIGLGGLLLWILRGAFKGVMPGE